MTHTRKVAITGAAGQIAYSLIFRIANGELFGPTQKVDLHLLDLPGTETALQGLAMELEDCAFPLLGKVVTCSQAERAFEEVDTAFLIGAKPRGAGMERKDLLSENGKIFVEQGKALNHLASKDVRVLVVGNPCNTNCLIAMHHAPTLPKSHFHAMTRLDQNRAHSQLAKKANVSLKEVKRVTIWGNHSSTQVPDFTHAEIKGKKATEVIHDLSWLKETFFKKIQQRGSAVIAARGKSSAASAANAALMAMHAIYHETTDRDWFSSGVSSDYNPYGIRINLVFSFPCRSKGTGEVEIVEGLKFDPFIAEKIALTERELIEERDLVAPLLRGT